MTVNIFYRKIPPSSVPYLFVAGPEDYSLFSWREFISLPTLRHETYQKFLQDYSQILNAFWQKNQDRPCFSYLPFSLRNTWQSRFYYGMESYARLSLLREGDVYFTSPHWFLWAVKNFPHEASARDIRRARADALKCRAKNFLKRLKGIRFALSQYSPQVKVPTGIRHAFFSIWTPAGQKKWQSSASDPFYDNIPSAMNNALIIYHLEGAQYCKYLDYDGRIVLRDTMLLSLFDWASLIKAVISFKVHIPMTCNAPLGAVEDDVVSSIMNQMVLGLISYYAALNIARVNQSANFVTLFEGNCWEQGVLRAAAINNRNVTSVQHTAFSLGTLKMSAHDYIRRPSRIITTGPVVTELLTTHMGYDKKVIETGCRLRNDAGNTSAPSERGKKILILLQGAPHENFMLSQLEKVHLPLEILVRDHPSQPLGGYIGLDRSKGSMADDLKDAALVIYNGTTAVFDALLAGIPCIYFSCGDECRNDPLFNTGSAIKRDCLDVADLPRIVDEVINLPDCEYSMAIDKMHAYIQGYFKSPTPGDVENVIRILEL